MALADRVQWTHFIQRSNTIREIAFDWVEA